MRQFAGLSAVESRGGGGVAGSGVGGGGSRGSNL